MEQLITFFKETGIIWVALFGFAGTILAPVLSPWIESKREERRIRREEEAAKKVPYTEAYAALAEALSEADTSQLYRHYSAPGDRGVPSNATKALAKALARCPEVSEPVAEEIRFAAQKIRTYAEAVSVSGAEARGVVEAIRIKVLSPMESLEKLIREKIG